MNRLSKEVFNPSSKSKKLKELKLFCKEIGINIGKSRRSLYESIMKTCNSDFDKLDGM